MPQAWGGLAQIIATLVLIGLLFIGGLTTGIVLLIRYLNKRDRA